MHIFNLFKFQNLNKLKSKASFLAILEAGLKKNMVLFCQNKTFLLH